MSEEIRLVSALCTQCGGKLEVDPQKETFECPFCGTTFAVEKAISNYNVKYAKIEHADNVNIDMSGTVNTVLDFVGKQMSESREAKREAKRAEKEESRKFFMNFIKFALVFFAIAIVAWIIMNIFDKGDEGGSTADNPDTYEQADDSGDYETGVVYYNIEGGKLYLDIPAAGGNTWDYDSINSTLELKESREGEDDFHFVFKAAEDEGTGYAVLVETDGQTFKTVDYMVYKVEIEDHMITDIIEDELVYDISEYSFF